MHPQQQNEIIFLKLRLYFDLYKKADKELLFFIVFLFFWRFFKFFYTGTKTAHEFWNFSPPEKKKNHKNEDDNLNSAET